MSSEEPASKESLSIQMLKELQSWWEIPSIAQYISLFRESFNLPEIEIEELENALIDDTIKEPSQWLQDLLYAFLRTIMPGRINKENWEIQLRKLVLRRWPEDNPFQHTFSFNELNLRFKVEIIYSLCLYRLDKNDIVDIMKSMDADALRVQKLGVDNDANTYWYFYGTRLYKEVPNEKPKSWDEEWKKQKRKSFKKRGRGRPRKIRSGMKSDGESDDFEDCDGKKNNGYMNVNAKSRWSVVCDTIEEWVSFAEKFKNSKSKDEKALFQIVQENFLPTLNKIYEEKEKKLQEKIRELMPVREKIVTRRETKKLRGEIFELPDANGYYDEAQRLHMVKDRARRLEERNRRASEAANGTLKRTRRKRLRYSDAYDSRFSSRDREQETEEYRTALLPNDDDNSVDLQDHIEKLLSTVKLHKDAWPFLYPVKEDQAPGYYEIIEEPMDLSKITNKLYEGQYETLGELDSDFSKMVTNCELYNGENHAYSKMVQSLWKIFRKGISKILDSLSPTESTSGDSHSNESSENSNQDSNIETYEPPSKKFKDGRKRKKKTGLEALEMLAHASELAIQSSNSNDIMENSNSVEQNNSNEFPSLKVMPIHSHPPELVEKFSSSESSNDSAEESSSSSYSNQDDSFNGQYNTPSSINGDITVTSMNYINNNLTHLTNFIEKNNPKGLNILTNNDVSKILSDASSSHLSSSSSSSSTSSSSSSSESSLTFSKEGSPVNLDILDECNENVSSILSHLMKQPIYNADNQLLSSNKETNTESFIENNTKQTNKNIRKSPLSPTFTGNLIQDTMNLDESSGSVLSTSSDISTVDASSIGITSYNAFPKKSRYLNMLESTNDNFAVENRNTITSNGQSEMIISKQNHSIQPKHQISPNEIIQEHFYENSSANQTENMPNISYQSLNLDISNSICNTQADTISTTESQIPIQIPASFSKVLQPQARSPNQLQKLSPDGNQVVYVSEQNKGTEGLLPSYHVYAPAKTNSNTMEELATFRGDGVSAATQVSPHQQYQLLENQVKLTNRTTPPKKRSPIPQQFSATSSHVPSESIASASSTSKITLPVTSSNFVPVHSMHTASKDKTSGKRMKIRDALQRASQNNNHRQTSNANLNTNDSNFSNDHLFQAVPLVLSSYNQPPNDVRMKNNAGAPMNVPTNMCLPNGVPIMQQVIIPAGAQQFPVQGGGQFVFATAQSNGNRMFNKGQNIQISNSMRQMNHGLGKGMPQVVAPAHMIQVTKDNLMHGFQIQPVSPNSAQAYTQVAPNPPFVGIPTYMIANQGSLQDPSAQTMINVPQSCYLPQRRPYINGQGNG